MNNILRLTVISLLLCNCTVRNNKEETINEYPTVFADGIELTDLNGNHISLSQYRNKTIILNVWATWCKPCIQEMPSFETLQKQLPKDSYSLLFASNESIQKIKQFKNSSKFNLQFVQLSTSLESLGVFALPTTFIINDKGELIITENGAKDWSSEQSQFELTHLPEL